jgi:hypothetical protein
MQSIAAIAGTGEAVSAEYRHERELIEKRHGNDDGTERHFHRLFGDCTDYADKIQPDPLLDDDNPARLTEFGLETRDCNRVTEYCHDIGEVRSAVREHAIPKWRQAGPVTEQHVIEALKKADEVTG